MPLRRWLACARHLAALSFAAVLLPWHATAISRRAAGWAARQAVAVDRAPAGALRPKLFFLFMARDALPNEQVWTRFFAAASAGTEYEVLVHCTNEARCRKTIQDQTKFQLIPTSPSKWCTDLVSPMNALLQHALSSDGPGLSKAGHAYDKFIFLSDTTVPVKPFRHVQQMLGYGDGSNSSFCIRPWWTWAWHDATDVAVKHDQWFILSREHVLKALAAKEGPQLMHRQLTPLHWASVEWLARGLYNFNTRILKRILSARFSGWIVTAPFASGCIDEYWHFASVFGFVDRDRGSLGVDVPGLSSGRLVMDESTAKQTQGRCDTYVRFDRIDVFPEFTEALEEAADTIWEQSKSFKHPGRFEQLSEDSLHILRDSPFLFTRKVDSETNFAGGMTLPDAFDTFVFSSGLHSDSWLDRGRGALRPPGGPSPRQG
mmetsp:Transcript_23344/g.66493  ORF Transcript_23344/g.66493 Transcript_23344/m.66493 type:complete len:431 (-) Transcript_23344:78-1370(-)